jgi:ribosomal protein S18 acetylase RimI-like enzyme
MFYCVTSDIFNNLMVSIHNFSIGMVDAMNRSSMKHSTDVTRNEARKRRRQVRLVDIFRSMSEIPYNCSLTPHQGGFGSANRSFTFRLTHQESGYAARTLGEEKILIFRSDRPGAIAKIVFSSLLPNCFSDAEETIEARISCLHVKEHYRGYDLGGLLFRQATATIRSRYGKIYASSEDEDFNHHETYLPCTKHPAIIKCYIDAEEDDDRHSKLVRFYERLGCFVKPGAKIQYLSGSDGRTYRKVPMQINLEGQTCTRASLSDRTTMSSFLPVLLCFKERRLVSVKTTRDPVRWLLVQNGKDDLQLTTTSGFYLVSQKDAQCSEGLSLVDSDHVVELQSKLAFEYDTLRNPASQSDNWTVRFVSTGFYLSVDVASGNLICSTEPSYWRAGEQELSLTWVGNYYHEPGLVDSDSECQGSALSTATLS